MVVDLPVGLVDEAGLGDNVGGALSIGGRWPRLTFQLPPGQAFKGFSTTLKKLPLLLFREGGDVTRVVEAVVDEGPVALEHRLGDLRKVLQYADVERCRASDVMPI